MSKKNLYFILAALALVLILYTAGSYPLNDLNDQDQNFSTTTRYRVSYEVVPPPGGNIEYGEAIVGEEELWYITGQDKPYPKTDWETAKREHAVKK